MTTALTVALSVVALGASCAGDVVDGGSGGATGAKSGLPCDVFNFLQTHCTSCHAGKNPPAMVALGTIAELTAKSSMYPDQTVAQRSLARIQDAAKPMPPQGGLPADEVAKFAAWVNGGTPRGSCDQTVEPPTPVCTSNQILSGMTCESAAAMNPGTACITCHQNPPSPPCEAGGDLGPPLGFAGTVYPTFHEPDLCVATGVAGAQVVVVDANDQTLTANVLGNGNFAFEDAAALPYKKVSVVMNGKSVDMLNPGAPVDGDCNRCHTVDGLNDAPGRIVPPQ